MKHLISTLVFLFCTLIASAQIEIPAPLSDRPEQVIHHTGYTLSYNSTHGTPNWSAWVLTKTRVLQGKVSRSDAFLADPSIPVTYRIQPTDYQGSGYDRGHMEFNVDANVNANCFL